MLSYPLIYLFIRYLYFCNPRHSWPFQLVWFFDRSALIRVFEAERTGGLLLFWFLKSRFPAAKSCLLRSNSRWMRKNGAIFGVTLFWRSSTDGFGESPECEACRLKVKCAVDFFGKVCSREVRFWENTLLVWRRRIRFVAGMLGCAGYRKNRSVKIYIFDSV